jgi:dTDP-4-dehydrorhamnose reductase
MSASKLPAPRLELWAGVECTVNRVGDSYFDQLERTGHDVRLRDLDRLAELGITSLRYPILWERTASHGIDQIDWSWADERLNRLLKLNIKPIVGLVHHGSGPRDTSLLDPEFPEKLAKVATAVARRYPWVDCYTPVNEPLTTARFSCLYGHWYPHSRDPLLFARALLGQCRAIVLSMREIRKVNQGAQLIQTEDLGKTFSTQTLAYQADFENERRWLTYDLLSGKLGPSTPMWKYLRWLGIPAKDLSWFLANPMPPDIVGINHYITSERFLDERIARYPHESHGGNGRHRYADVEAVRVCAEGVSGPRAIMREAWERYGLAIAITEAHLSCTREEQLRWFKEIWDAAQELRSDGVDVRAVTAWSAFGAYDWNSLVTRNEGSYEPGVFDLRAPAPRATALARMAQGLATGATYDHPTLASPGWWHRFDRLSYPAVIRRAPGISVNVTGPNVNGESSRPLLITGATGTLGRAFARICERRGITYRLLSRQEMDIADADSVKATLDRFEPWALINAAGYVCVDDAEREVEKCMRENVAGPVNLARECARRNASFVTFSSDLVFDGAKTVPYLESDKPAPLNVYGASKAECETGVLDVFPRALVVRTSAFFGPWDSFNFVHAVLEGLSMNQVFSAPDDLTVSPTYVPDLVNATLDLLIDDECGIWHLANSGATTWAEFARSAARAGGYDTHLINACSSKSLPTVAARPAFSALGSERASLLPSIDEALNSYFEARKQSSAHYIASAQR